jgi:hypothetical protein
MPPISSKGFKKKYAASTRGVTGDGVWSGRGIGIPSLGAVDGSSDGSKYLGRPRRPPQHGDMGSPSQSADSGMASLMARVNKGWDGEYESLPMFPEQEEEEEHIYSWEDVDPVVSAKVPRSFKLAAKSRIRESGIFDDDVFVKSSRYSLSDVMFEGPIDDGLIAADKLSDIVQGSTGLLVDLGVDVVGDVAMSAIGAVTGPGDVAMIAAALFNVNQLTNNMVSSSVAIERFKIDPTESTRDDLQKEFNNIVTNIVDLIQRTLSAVPAPGADAAPGLLLTVLQSLDKINKVLSTALGTGRWMPNVKIAVMVKPALSIIAKIFESDLEGELSGAQKITLDEIPDRLVLLSELIDDFDAQETISREMEEDDFEYDLPGDEPSPEQQLPQDIEAVDAPQEPVYMFPDTYDPEVTKSLSGLLGSDIGTIKWLDPKDLREGNMRVKKVSMRELKDIIQEAKESLGSYHPPRPTGYTYREVPTIISKETADNLFDVFDGYDDLSVMYKTDGGAAAYQVRNKLVEEALRRVIRRNISAIMSESKKKAK